MELKEPIVDFFKSYWTDLPDGLCENISTALYELLGNSIEHGCSVNPKCACELTYIRTSRLILLQIRDAGPGFELKAIPHAALNNPPGDPLQHMEERSKLGMRPGGFGIMLVKQIADDLIYNEQGNEVVFVKYLT